MTNVLDGLLVVDCSQVIQAAASANILQELGAQVIKIESPLGDISRTWTHVLGVSHELPGGRNATFEWVNRGKRSITLDLSTDGGREVLSQLVTKADVFVTNHRKDVRERLRFDYESLKAVNPQLVYGVGNAYGGRGPSSGQGGYDNVAFARSGLMYCVGGDSDEPQYMTAGLVDQAAGTMLALGILAALLARPRLGHGQQVESSLLGTVLHLMSTPLNTYLLTGHLPTRPSRTKMSSPLVGWYRCRDDRWLMLSITRPQTAWPQLCQLLGLVIADDVRFASAKARAQNSGALIAMIDQAMLKTDREDWIARLEGADIMCAPVNRIEDLPMDAQVIANGYIKQVAHDSLGPTRLVALPLGYSSSSLSDGHDAPELGQHTEEILLELGYDWDGIDELRESRSI